MTRYRLSYAEPAILELDDAYSYIYRDSPEHAEAWRQRLENATESLKSSPRRCPLAPENAFSESEIRHLVFENYRILFTIDEDTVLILHIRHAARAPMTPDELLPPDMN